jgi:coenzyme F420-reducing hydrogenase delta subunit/ferredoxin
LVEQVTEERVALTLNEDYCSSCSICSALCPYEAIKKDAETGKTVLEIEKCQVCGLCYSTCPAKCFDIIYYDIDSLTRYLERAKQEYDSDTLVIMCKGSAPDFTGVGELFGVTKFIPLSVPCVGRIPEEVYLKALVMGIKGINILACDDDYCRFEKGSPITERKILALNLLWGQLGYGTEVITLKRNTLKVKVDRESCIACGNCVYYCPYDAAKLDSPGSVTFDLDACKGCGLCVAMCPALALELENWERDSISTLISKLSSEMEQPKILVFRCQWAAFPSLDNGQLAPNIRLIDLPCAAGVEPFHVLEAFQKGVDGILIAACAEDDCKLEKAGGKTEHLIERLRERLSQIGLQERLHFCTVAPRYPDRFDRELEQFSKKIENIGLEESQ